MSRATSLGVYYLPHHGVHKSTPQGPKLRVVFNASPQSSNGNSLNDVLLTGSKLQNDIFDLLLLDLPIRIPRYAFSPTAQKHQLAGFSDAFEKGYAAVVYVRVLTASGERCVNFLVAKTRVAPIKTITIPKLELLAALLLAKLLNRILNVLKVRIHISRIFAWTDSNIFKMFVANRVSMINDYFPCSIWHYINSAQNLADCASRGIFPSQLPDATLFWKGPDFLELSEDQWPVENGWKLNLSLLPELKPVNSMMGLVQQENFLTWMDRFSSYVKLVRSFAYVLRFIASIKGEPCQNNFFISGSERFQALIQLVKLDQHYHFQHLTESIKKGKQHFQSSLSQLRPFLEPPGILRVSGRLLYSSLSSSTKHPILLSKDSHLSRLIVRHYHLVSLHGGPRSVEALVARQFWILSARSGRIVYPESGIIWKFNPPSAPHFGGLWEAWIKSIKYHLRRFLNGQTLNFEDFATQFCKIEAVLNSRSLTAKSSDPGEIDCLTLGHFLFGRPLISLPEYISNEEYLHTLQQHSKWTQGIGDPKIGDLVLIREPKLPPSLWKMG
ncbi:hypothetical protein J437_LFUL010635 [Ladona fulva]|uniref:DUF5641 domain-containing protein n=1 Tax=Ladona fulva TaxID=123851 RepID=A0A8K0KQM7_LADFU|nr:hypothetical protein J437_LFUL010635 [Ladona fulva]